MDTIWRDILWLQFGAAIDALDDALVHCPDALWQARMWPVLDGGPPGLAEFWYIGYHTLFWLDLGLSGALAGFAPPAPFTLDELDPAGVVPDPPYTREQIRDYLAYVRHKGHDALTTLTVERAHAPVQFPWSKGKPFSYLEWQLYNLRHVQEHSAQLRLFLGQQGVAGAPSWVARARG